MKQRFAPRKTAKGKSLLLTFLLLLSIPVFVFGLLQDNNFDFRNMAFQDVEVSEDTPCVITFPNVNPYSLEVGQTVRVQIDAISTTLGVKGISVHDENSNTIFEKIYENPALKITETFSFTPQEARSYNLSGLMVDLNEKSYVCVISSPYDIKGIRAISNNSKPVFTSAIKDSKPALSIKTTDTYEYTLTATDTDGDTINYFYSFTPGDLWLKPTVIEDGSNGKLTIKFKGSTPNPASYLANVFIHDGYSKHLASQSWVISVSPANNDIPVVRILEPLSSIELKDSVPIQVEWDATDQNHITKYEIYVSSNPANTNTWIKLNDNIPYTQTKFNISTDNLKDGTYRIIVKAIDNQTPAGEGIGISEEIILARGNTPITPDDQVELPQPQVINVSPTSTDEIKNNRPTIKASLIASQGNKINEDSIVVKLDSKDITDQMSFNKISESEYTVIYLPEADLDTGIHKVEITFKDSANTEITKDWTFTIQGTEEDTNDINLFGLSIPKRTALIVAGGIGLIILAVVIPIIIFAVWKDQSKESVTSSTTLPPQSIPETPIPLDTISNDMQQLTREEEFVAPVPDIQESKEVPITPVPTQQEVTDDLSQIYSQIKEADESENAPQNSNPPEPIL